MAFPYRGTRDVLSEFSVRLMLDLDQWDEKQTSTNFGLHYVHSGKTGVRA